MVEGVVLLFCSLFLAMLGFGWVLVRVWSDLFIGFFWGFGGFLIS